MITGKIYKPPHGEMIRFLRSITKLSDILEKIIPFLKYGIPCSRIKV